MKGKETIDSMPTIEVSEDCISREWVRNELNEVTAVTPTQSDMLVDFYGIIKNAPSATTEQSSIVRCKDCTHYHASKDYAYCTVINVKGKHPQPNDYCSYAEEK